MTLVDVVYLLTFAIVSGLPARGAPVSSVAADSDLTLDSWSRADLIAEVVSLRIQLADKNRMLRIARMAIDEGLSDGGGVASPP
jgi:hypothetical protein